MNTSKMKKNISNLKTFLSAVLALSFFQASAQTKNDDAKMNVFVSGLMSKMTLDEKIGQLNLVTGGTPTTGSVVNKGIEENIKKGYIGGMFGIWGAGKVKEVQDIAVKRSRLHIPMIFGLDVIHGHETVCKSPSP